MIITYELKNLFAFIKDNFEYIKTREIRLSLYIEGVSIDDNIINIFAYTKGKWKFIHFENNANNKVEDFRLDKLDDEQFKKVITETFGNFSDIITISLDINNLFKDGKCCAISVNPKEKIYFWIYDVKENGHTTISVRKLGEEIELIDTVQSMVLKCVTNIFVKYTE